MAVSGSWPTPTANRRSGLQSHGVNAVLFPTPVASEHTSNRGGAAGRTGPVRLSLIGMARTGLWPTPTVHGNANRAGATSKSGDGLATAVRRWPTPMSRDWKSCSTAKKGNARPLSEHIPGSLNPTWVEWLMGFPLEWTALEPSATPSSRKSRRSSAARSSK